MPPKSARPAREPTGTFLGTGGCSPRLPGGGRWERAWPSGERALRMTRTKEPRYTGALARAQKPVSWRSSAPSLVIPLLKCAPNLPKNPLTSKPKGKQSPGSRENPGGLPSWPDATPCSALATSWGLRQTLGRPEEPWQVPGPRSLMVLKSNAAASCPCSLATPPALPSEAQGLSVVHCTGQGRSGPAQNGTGT